MPVNRNALIRYKTIDKCLQNHYRLWTLEDLIDSCSDALYEYEGIDKGVSKRTIQGDIQIMRSDKLGYNAPIIVKERKYYTYEDPNYSITNIPLSDQDLNMLYESIEFMKQFQGFSHFKELDGMVQKLEDHIYSQKTHTAPIIDFEKNENLKGLEFLDRLYQSILHKKAILITYQSFKARTPSSFDFHGYLLKEYRNRWFLIGRKQKEESILYLALDRILSIEESEKTYILNSSFNAATFFDNAIGVSVSPNAPSEKVTFFVTHKHAPYVNTKPFHHSQKEIERDNYGVTFSMDVQLNFELEKEILGLGDGIKVIAPKRLKTNIRERLNGALDLYQTELNLSRLKNITNLLTYKGTAKYNYIYTKREVKKIKTMLDKEFIKSDKNVFAKRDLFGVIPQLKGIILNKNLTRIIEAIDPEAFITKVIFFDKTPKNNWYVTWHQDKAINVAEKIDTNGYTGWTQKEDVISVLPPVVINQSTFAIRIHLDDTDESNGALKVFPGSHKGLLSAEQIKSISENSLPQTVEVLKGGVHVMKPLLLHSSSKTKQERYRKVIHIEFSSMELAGNLKWKEKSSITFS